jgi:hypothetical protein
MNRSMSTICYAALLSLSLVASPAMSAEESALPSEPEAKSPASESVQSQVDQQATDKAEEKRKTILADAKVAIEETKKALKALVENKERTTEDNGTLNELLKEARTQLELAKLLGYGNQEAYKPMYEQLDEIEQKTKGGKGGEGWFDKIKQQLSELF